MRVVSRPYTQQHGVATLLFSSIQSLDNIVRTSDRLAAGQGTRMKSRLSKVLHPVCGKPMLAYALAVAGAASTEKPVVVIGRDGDALRTFLGEAAVCVVQDPPLGTGHAVKVALPTISDEIGETDGDVLILDFKTGKPAAHESDVPRLYATQMALYRAAAARIFPGRRIACALVWTEGPSLLPLSAALLEAETIRIRTRLDPGGERT